MKIYVNARFLTQPITGVQRYGIECSRQINKLYHGVTFVSPPGILHTELAKELGVAVIGRNKGHVWEQLDLPLFLGSVGTPPLFNPGNTAPIRYSKNFVTIHDLAFHVHPEWNSKAFRTWYNYMVPRLAKRSKHLFTVSETVKAEIAGAYSLPPGKISVTYNGLSGVMQERGRGGRVEREKIVLAVGSINERKNHVNLVKGFMKSKLADDHRLVIVGGSHQAFKGVDADLIQGNQKVELFSDLDESGLADLYQRALILASVSRYEGFGIPVLEGLYAGCKVLCSDIPVYRELYGKYAHFCNPEDPLDIGKALDELGGHSYGGQLAELPAAWDYGRSAETILEVMTRIK